MTTEILLRYLHFVFVFIIVGTLVAENILVTKEMKRHELDRLSKIDGLYGLAALGLLAVGLTLWLNSIGKPAIFYSKNWIFHIKLSLFVALGLLSIYPTIYFLKKRRGEPQEVVTTPTVIFWLLRLELVLLLIIPFLAGLMAKGIGYSG
jgi:putative membrane protein